jgi:hypothetical protein
LGVTVVIVVVVVIMVMVIVMTMVMEDGSTVRKDVMLQNVADYFLPRMVGVMREPFKGLVGGNKDGVVVLVVAVGVVKQLLDVVVLVDDLGEPLTVLGLFDQFVDRLAGVSRRVSAAMTVVSVSVVVMVMVVIVMLVLVLVLAERLFQFLNDVFLDQRRVDGR